MKRIALPLSRDQARNLKAGELVIADGEVAITIGLPTHERILSSVSSGRGLPFDLYEKSLIHLGFCFKKNGPKLEPLYINPSTSTRFNALMPEVIRKLRLTAVGGKGGLSKECVDTMKEVGCVYLSIVGGASSFISDAVKEIIETHWGDLIMQFRLTRIRVQNLGPLTVGIDAHGNSVYEDLSQSARCRLPEIIANLDRSRVHHSIDD